MNTNEFDGLPFYDETSETLYFITSVDGTNVLKTIAIPKSTLTNPN